METQVSQVIVSTQSILVIIVVALLIEAIVETIKPIYDKEKGWNRDALIALAVSVVVCVLTGADAFLAVGAPLVVPFAGSVLTGILASRGANFIHDLLKKVGAVASAVPTPTELNAGVKH